MIVNSREILLTLSTLCILGTWSSFSPPPLSWCCSLCGFLTDLFRFLFLFLYICDLPLILDLFYVFEILSWIASEYRILVLLSFSPSTLRSPETVPVCRQVLYFAKFSCAFPSLFLGCSASARPFITCHLAPLFRNPFFRCVLQNCRDALRFRHFCDRFLILCSFPSSDRVSHCTCLLCSHILLSLSTVIFSQIVSRLSLFCVFRGSHCDVTLSSSHSGLLSDSSSLRPLPILLTLSVLCILAKVFLFLCHCESRLICSVLCISAIFFSRISWSST